MIELKNLFSFIIITVIIIVCNGVRITNFNVPPVYILDKNPEPLILDCEYELNSTDISGFVLKWQLNNQNIYQWILGSPHPSPWANMKNHINVNHTASSDDIFKYRALEITKPTINMTGNYTCYITSFASHDKRTSNLKIIVPESSFQIKLTEESDHFKVECTVNDIFPEPKLTIFTGGDTRKRKIDVATKSKRDEKDGLFDIYIIGTIKKIDNNESDDDENDYYETDDGKPLVKCYLEVPDTNYTKLVEYSRSSIMNSPKLLILKLIILIFLINIIKFTQ